MAPDSRSRPDSDPVTDAADRRTDSTSILTPDVDSSAAAVPVGAGAPEPSLEATRDALRSPLGRSTGVTVLAVLAVLYSLYFARDFLIPIVFALLLDFLLSPIVRAMSRIRIPPPLGAGIIILTIIGVLGSGVFGLSGSVSEWTAAAPHVFAKAERRLQTLITPFQKASKTAEQVAHAASDAASGQAAGRPATVVVQGPSITSRIFGTTQRSVVRVLEVLVLLFFLLAAGDLFLQKLVKVLPNMGEKKKAVEIARQTEASISTYLITAASVNLIEGVIVGVVMHLLGMPNPAL